MEKINKTQKAVDVVPVSEELKETLASIIKDAEDIDYDQASNEIIDWLIKNVGNYVDNHEYFFTIDIVLDPSASEAMPNAYRLQKLFSDIPEPKIPAKEREKIMRNINKTTKYDKWFTAIGACRDTLNEFVVSLGATIRTKKAKLADLYEAMSEYYHLRMVDGQLVRQKLPGAVDITNFGFDPFDLPVIIKHKDAGGNVTSIDDQTINAGYTLSLEISFSKNRQAAIF